LNCGFGLFFEFYVVGFVEDEGEILFRFVLALNHRLEGFVITLWVVVSVMIVVYNAVSKQFN
jgi:hypothetical protein